MYGPVLVSPGDEEELADYVIRKFSVQMVSLFWIICTYVAFSEMVSEPIWVREWVSQLSQPVIESVSEEVSQTVSRWVSRSVSQSASEPVSQSLYESASQTISWWLKQSVSGESVSQSFCQSVCDSMISWTVEVWDLWARLKYVCKKITRYLPSYIG